MSFKSGDWVRVKESADIPAVFREGPTIGRVDAVSPASAVDEETVIVHVPIGDDHIDAHSQAVPYHPHELESAEPPERYR